MTKRVPSQPAPAPSVSAAASPRPSPIPPAPTTGTDPTASTTAGIKGSDATEPRTWPPASHPWATTTSTPASTTRRASSALPIVCMTSAPPAWAIGTRGAGSPQKSETIGTPSPTTRRTRSSCGHSRIRFTPKGRSESAFIWPTISSIWSGSDQLRLIMPSAPALLTAAARGGRARPPIGAWTIGMSMPTRRVNDVSKAAVMGISSGPLKIRVQGDVS